MTATWHIDAEGTIDERARRFVDELKGTILTRYPEATFEIAPGNENPTAIHLHAFVDLDDPFDVTDELLDRIVDIQVDEGVPLHVIPHRYPPRLRGRQPDESERHSTSDT
jgi:hypothetical protein